MRYSFAFADKKHLEPILPELFKLLNANMEKIAPTGNSYEHDYRIWLAGICVAMQQPGRQIVLMYCNERIVGYFQYYIYSGVFMMEEIQIEPLFHGKGIFSAFYTWLLHRLPNDIQTVEAYAHKKNIKSQGILEHLGLRQIGVSKNGNSYFYQGNYCDLKHKYATDITYRTQKELPCKRLYDLFLSVGWADESDTTAEMIDHFNVPFVNSTIVISAWDNDKLVGCVRVLSDTVFRSHLYDLAVLPEYQNQGIGTELVKRCIAHFPNSEWNLETIPERIGFYKQLGFEINKEPVLKIKCKLF